MYATLVRTRPAQLLAMPQAIMSHAMSRTSFGREENPLRETGFRDQWVNSPFVCNRCEDTGHADLKSRPREFARLSDVFYH